MLYTKIYAYKSIFCNNYSIELGPPIIHPAMTYIVHQTLHSLGFLPELGWYPKINKVLVPAAALELNGSITICSSKAEVWAKFYQ